MPGEDTVNMLWVNPEMPFQRERHHKVVRLSTTSSKGCAHMNKNSVKDVSELRKEEPLLSFLSPPLSCYFVQDATTPAQTPIFRCVYTTDTPITNGISSCRRIIHAVKRHVSKIKAWNVAENLEESYFLLHPR